MRKLFSTIILILLYCHLHGQKVALVMSGGGAKGIAHVGVIKAFEEHDLPIDYVVGTSMGAIVAGCYAAGYSAAQIERLMTDPTFMRWVNGEFDKGLEYNIFQDSKDASFAKVSLTLDSTFTASLNTSIATDVSLNFALAEYLAKPGAASGNNFDSLFVPARIVAAEIFTQREVIMKDVSLPLALRTSLSVPFFYRPIRINGQYLFDGGVYNNFPVDVAKDQFSPDIIIGSNVASKVYEEYPTDDDRLINNSLLFMLLNKSDPAQIPQNGTYIEPDLRGYNAFDFSKAQALIDSGYAATISKIEKIKGSIENRVTKAERAESRQDYIAKQSNSPFNAINFHGYNSRQRRYIRRLFEFHKKDELSWDEIKKGYFKLVSEKYFSSVYPDISYSKERDRYALELYGRPKNNFNVSIGGVISTRDISQIYLGLQFYYFDNYLLKNTIDFYAGTFYKSARLRSRLFLSYPSLFYVEPELIYNNWDFIESSDVFIDEDVPTLLKRTDRLAAINIGIPLGNKMKLVASGGYVNNNDSYSNTSRINNQDTLDLLELDGFKQSLSWEKSNFNRKQYPSKGSGLMIRLDYFNLKEKYQPGSTTLRMAALKDHEWFTARGKWEQYFHKGKWSTGYLVEAVTSTQSFMSNYTGTLLNMPGFNPLQDSKTLFLQNFKAFSFGALGIKNVFAIRQNLDFRLEGYLFKPLVSLRQTDEIQKIYFNNDEVFASGTAGLVLHSPVGPLSVSLNYYDDPENRLGVLFHVGYLLFNKNSIGY